MRVYNYIRGYTFFSEWHVLLPVSHSNGSLLTMPTSKLISYLGHPNTPDLNLSKLVALYIISDHDLIHNAILTPPQSHTTILMCLLT